MESVIFYNFLAVICLSALFVGIAKLSDIVNNDNKTVQNVLVVIGFTVLICIVLLVFGLFAIIIEKTTF